MEFVRKIELTIVILLGYLLIHKSIKCNNTCRIIWLAGSVINKYKIIQY